MSFELQQYNSLLSDIKLRVRQGQMRASLSANAEMLAAYWDIGRMIHKRQQNEGWGMGVIPRLAIDLKNELPEVKGFSERNIQFMIQFYTEYSDNFANTKLPVSYLRNSISPFSKTDDELGSITKLPVSQFQQMNKPIGISEYELTRILPENLKSSLPSVEEIEEELNGKLKGLGKNKQQE